MTDEQIASLFDPRDGAMQGLDEMARRFARRIEAAATAPLLERIASLEKLRSEDLSHAVDMAATIEALEAKLAQLVPDGWAMVPVNPTTGMLYAADKEFGSRGLPSIAMIAYQTMLSAAPAAPEQQGPTVLQLAAGAFYPQATAFAAQAPKAQQAEAQEPCAWVHVCRKKPVLRVLTFGKDHPSMAARGYKAEPLFTRPQPSQLQALSEEEIDAAVAPLYKNSAAQRMGRIDDLSTAKVIQSALAAKNGAVLK
jgi:hypothetical protein